MINRVFIIYGIKIKELDVEVTLPWQEGETIAGLPIHKKEAWSVLAAL